ncbi:hypothetical protein D5086_034007, partial [Populus alba]
VAEVNGEYVVCLVKNCYKFDWTGYVLCMFSQIHTNLPTLTDKDKEVFCFYSIVVIKAYIES